MNFKNMFITFSNFYTGNAFQVSLIKYHLLNISLSFIIALKTHNFWCPSDIHHR